MRLIVLHNEAMVADVVCEREAVCIGSREDCGIHLTEGRVGEQQALVYPEGNADWRVKSLDEACIVRVNSTTVTEDLTLHAGDEIRIDEYAIRVYPDYQNQATARAAVGTSRAQLERFAQARLPAGTVLKKLDEPLALKGIDLDRVGRSALSVSGCSAVPELMDIVLGAVLTTFAAQRAWIGVRRLSYGTMDYEEGRLITGQPADLPELANHLKPRILDRTQFVLVPIFSREERMSVLAGPLVGPDGPLGMVYLDSGDSGRHFDQHDLDSFAVQMHVFAYQLDAIFKASAKSRAAMIDGQVSVAHEIQARLTPRKLPQSADLQFGAFREPGRKRCGDIYDVLRLPNRQMALMVGHTPAEGALPSMLMAQAQTAFRFAAIHQDAPNALLKSLNWMLFDGRRDHPQSCFAGVIDPATGQMQYSMAGHVGAFIIGQRGEERTLCPTDPTPELGALKGAAYPLLTEQLEPGETLALFTPGVTTAKNRNGETFGEDRFVNLLCDGFGQLASAMMKEMLTDLRNFTEDGLQPDDITVVLAHRVA